MATPNRFPGIMSMKDAIRIASRLGCDVSMPRRTGEVLVVSPGGYRVRASVRRKDIPRKLIALLRSIPETTL